MDSIERGNEKHAPQPGLAGRDKMLRAFMDRDRSYDGQFIAAVTTTGVFCRPSCPARKPDPGHVEFFTNARQALFAGFRPCLRCDPLCHGTGAPSWLRSLVNDLENGPRQRIPDAELRARGLDPVAVRRWFIRSHGMTFQAYCRARRLGEAFTAIKQGGRLGHAVFDHDWESHPVFRDAFLRIAGRSPGAARGADFIRLSWLETPLGPMVAGAKDEALCLLEFTDRRMLETQVEVLQKRLSLPAIPGDSPLFAALKTQMAEYFAGSRRRFELPLAFPGTDFQRRVWEGLQRIPYGQTRSYAELAVDIGVSPGASRAVGRANGENRIAVLIPCHRVIAADGSLGGYGGGLWRKLRLLERENAERADLLR